MIKELTKLANHLDSKGLSKEADCLDNVIEKIARYGARSNDPVENAIRNFLDENDIRPEELIKFFTKRLDRKSKDMIDSVLMAIVPNKEDEYGRKLYPIPTDPLEILIKEYQKDLVEERSLEQTKVPPSGRLAVPEEM
jgi:superfamily I DNA and/or RNA helicase